MALKGWGRLDASACIPNSNSLVFSPRDDFGSIGRECDRMNQATMASKGWEHLDAGACIPNSNGIVI
jgi:hypothetical protein